MVQGTLANGDYFIDCPLASQPTSRAIFGAWITIYSLIIPTCVCFTYQSRLKNQLVTGGQKSAEWSLWTISPPTTLFEVFQLRAIILPRIFSRKEFFFTITWLVCILATIVGAFSTAIANHSIENNIATRQATVPGWLASPSYTAAFLIENVTSRIQALDYANAPLEELFDFAPDDDSRWVYVAQEWNNSWHSQCDYHLYPAVDLVVYTTNSTDFQDLVPSLGAWLPQWASDNATVQGQDIFGNYNDSFPNNTGAYRDLIFTFVFYNPPFTPNNPWNATFNVSLANILLHHIGRTNDGYYVETAFKSDVNVVECVFKNPGYPTHYRYESLGGGGDPNNTAVSVADVYRFQVFENSIAEQPVIQPTGRQMLRYWQAYMSVKDTLNGPRVERQLSVARPVVQIRLSALVVTIGSALMALGAVIFSRMAEPRTSNGKHVTLPNSPLEWTIQAACQRNEKDRILPDPAAFIATHKQLEYEVSATAEKDIKVHIAWPSQQKVISSAMERSEHDGSDTKELYPR